MILFKHADTLSCCSMLAWLCHGVCAFQGLGGHASSNNDMSKRLPAPKPFGIEEICVIILEHVSTNSVFSSSAPWLPSEVKVLFKSRKLRLQVSTFRDLRPRS
jgi:hypothetical protein